VGHASLLANARSTTCRRGLPSLVVVVIELMTGASLWMKVGFELGEPRGPPGKGKAAAAGVPVREPTYTAARQVREGAVTSQSSLEVDARVVQVPPLQGSRGSNHRSSLLGQASRLSSPSAGTGIGHASGRIS
jgi:hypothetical protein